MDSDAADATGHDDISTRLAASSAHHLPEEHAIVPEFVVYSLCPYNIDDDNGDQMVTSPYAVSKLTEAAEAMTPKQIGVVRTFLEYVQQNSPDAESLRRFIEPALETVWKL